MKCPVGLSIKVRHKINCYDEKKCKEKRCWNVGFKFHRASVCQRIAKQIKAKRQMKKTCGNCFCGYTRAIWTDGINDVCSKNLSRHISMKKKGCKYWKSNLKSKGVNKNV
jgi:hypothetical protein